MLLFGHKFKNIKPRLAFLLPLLAIAAWWGMLTAMLVCWVIQGRPLYKSNQVYFHTFITYLSNVGATNLQPLFIVGCAVMGVFYVWSLSEEFYLRSNRRGYLLISYTKSTHVLHWFTIVWSTLASLSILLVSCLKNNEFSVAHSTFVGLFIFFDFCMAVCHIALYIIYYRHYHKRWFLTSAILKAIWVVLALSLVLCYLVFDKLGGDNGHDSVYWGYSAVFEWSLCFWFSIVLILLSIDLFMNKNKNIDTNTETDPNAEAQKAEEDIEGFNQDDNTLIFSETTSNLNGNIYNQPSVATSPPRPTHTAGYY